MGGVSTSSVQSHNVRSSVTEIGVLVVPEDVESYIHIKVDELILFVRKRRQ